MKVTGEDVASDQIIKGYEVGKGQVTDEDLETIVLESAKTIEIDEFKPKSEIARGRPAAPEQYPADDRTCSPRVPQAHCAR